MSDKTAIEWAEATWNPVTGCTKISPGCKFCYAERITERWGQKFTEIKLHPDRLFQPLHWKKPRRIFVCSMSDLFHESIPDDFVESIFAIMAETPRHQYQVLTKRAEQMRQTVKWWNNLPSENDHLYPFVSPVPNIWLGVSVENQEQADKRIPVLLETPAAVRFLSVEPLLGPVDLRNWLPHVREGAISEMWIPGMNWVIVGGESGGPRERMMVEDSGCNDRSGAIWVPKDSTLKWTRSLRDQCVASGVPFFFKQWGGPTPKSGGRLLDGKEWSEYPGERR